MKSISKVFLTLFFAMSYTSYAMAQEEFKTETKRIEVSGTAEMEIIPDEIYYSITLREYNQLGF